MKTIREVIACFAMMCALSGAIRAATPEADSRVDRAPASTRVRQYTLSGVETFSPRTHLHLRTFEVCVKPAPDGAPLKAIVDERTFRVSPAECRVLTGRAMTFLSLNKLDDNAHIVFTYREMPRIKHADGGAVGESS